VQVASSNRRSNVVVEYWQLSCEVVERPELRRVDLVTLASRSDGIFQRVTLTGKEIEDLTVSLKPTAQHRTD
jgi:hypothetical protein